MSSRLSRKRPSKVDELPTRWSDWGWNEEKYHWTRYRLDKNGAYEFEHQALGEADDSAATSAHADFRGSKTPRYVSSHDTAQADSGQNSLLISLDYTHESSTADLDLNKGKQPETAYIGRVASYPVASSIDPAFDPICSAGFLADSTTHTQSGHSTSPWSTSRANIYGAEYKESTTTSSYQPSYTYGGQYPQADDSSQQPFYDDQTLQRNPTRDSHYINTSTSGLVDKPDPRFKVHIGSDFEVGKVFKVLCEEPTGVHGSQITDDGLFARSRKFGEGFVYKIRSFLVVSRFHQHCLCLSIRTYGRKEAIDPRFNAQHHAVIYSDQDKAVTYAGENLTKKEIRVLMNSPKEKLEPGSRINYAKVYTIEYNVKAFFIGRVHQNDRHRVLADYQSTMGFTSGRHSNTPDTLKSSFLPGPSLGRETNGPLSVAPSISRKSSIESLDLAGGPSIPLLSTKPDCPSPSRRSSVDSLESIVFSTFAMSSTTASSVENGSGRAERLSDFLLRQEWLQKLSTVALQKVSPSTFEENLRRSLVQFSAHLKAEAASPAMTKAAGAVRMLARNAASLLRRSLESVSIYGDEQFGSYGLGDDDDDDEDDDALFESKEEDDDDDPQTLELLLSKSLALRLLEENLRLFIHPDPVKRALFKTWPITHPRESPFAIEYDLKWEVPCFLKASFPEGQELSKVLTITGEAMNAQAGSCGDYLQDTWPGIGGVLLDALQEFLSLSAGEEVKSGVVRKNELVSFNFKRVSSPDLESSTSNVSIMVHASHYIHEQVAWAFSWISASLRQSSHVNLALSSTSITAEKTSITTQSIAIRMLELKEIQTDQPCWHPLLPGAVIASGFPIHERTAGKGLEISFVDMAFLSHSMNFTEYDEGLILEGLRSVLIPMELLSQREAIQWHLEYKTQTKPPTSRSLAEIFATVPNSLWYKSQKPEDLCQKRCFLGWAKEVAVMIGTETFSAPNVFLSDASRTTKRCRVKAHSISLGTSGLGIGASASMTWQPSAVSSSIIFEMNKEIDDILRDKRRSSVLIFDTDQRIGWLLPQLSVILFLAHKVFLAREYEFTTTFKHAEPSADGAQEAFSILHELIFLQDDKSTSSENQKQILETIKQILFVLSKVREGLDSATTEFEKIGGGAEADLYGVELNEVLGLESPIDVKRHTLVDQPWTRMVRSKNCGIVLFCRGLGQPILPTVPEELCVPYQTVPFGRDLVVTTGGVLHAFMKYHNGPGGARLAETVEWEYKEESLIQSHTHVQTTRVLHEQILRIVKGAQWNPSILQSVEDHKRSGFIFTSRSSRACCSASFPITQKASSVKEESAEDGDPVLLPGEDDSGSEISLDTDSVFNSGQVATSSLYSDECPPTENEVIPVIQHLSDPSSSSVNRIWYSKGIQNGGAYVIDSSISKEMSTATSSSSTPRTVKKRDGCPDLRIWIEKGQGLVSVKEIGNESEISRRRDIPRNAPQVTYEQGQSDGKKKDRSRNSTRK